MGPVPPDPPDRIAREDSKGGNGFVRGTAPGKQWKKRPGARAVKLASAASKKKKKNHQNQGSLCPVTSVHPVRGGRARWLCAIRISVGPASSKLSTILGARPNTLAKSLCRFLAAKQYLTGFLCAHDTPGCSSAHGYARHLRRSAPHRHRENANRGKKCRGRKRSLRKSREHHRGFPSENL